MFFVLSVRVFYFFYPTPATTLDFPAFVTLHRGRLHQPVGHRNNGTFSVVCLRSGRKTGAPLWGCWKKHSTPKGWTQLRFSFNQWLQQHGPPLHFVDPLFRESINSDTPSIPARTTFLTPKTQRWKGYIWNSTVKSKSVFTGIMLNTN